MDGTDAWRDAFRVELRAEPINGIHHGHCVKRQCGYPQR
jgi:hypothetical protein